MNPDKPHAFRVRKITATRLRHSYNRPSSLYFRYDELKHLPHDRDEECPTGLLHYRNIEPAGWRTCDVCGGSEQLTIHDVEAARFRKRWVQRPGYFYGS